MNAINSATENEHPTLSANRVSLELSERIIEHIFIIIYVSKYLCDTFVGCIYFK